MKKAIENKKEQSENYYYFQSNNLKSLNFKHRTISIIFN